MKPAPPVTRMARFFSCNALLCSSCQHVSTLRPSGSACQHVSLFIG
jgi:hypothetical protein